MKKQAKGWETLSLRCDTYPIKGLYPAFTENSYNSVTDNLIKMNGPRSEQKMQPKTEISTLAQC